jgi:multiple sugar transport system permease protein
MATTALATSRWMRMTRSRRQAITGYLWIMPWLIGFVGFSLGPTVSAFALSLTRYDIITAPQWIGFDNYVYAVQTDPLFWKSLGRTLYYVGVSVPIGIVASLALALLLNMQKPGTATYRTMFFLPNLTPVVAAAVLWTWIYHPRFGPLNYLLGLVGVPQISWIGSAEWAIPSLILISLWAGVGGSRMVIFLAGLQSVPAELHEAAEVDGAGTWARFRFVTLPLISPTMFFNRVLALIGTLRVFEVSFLTTTGGPNYATWFYMLHLYQSAFRDFDMGYASALAVILFVITLILTYLQLQLSNRWVYYEGETRGN